MKIVLARPNYKSHIITPPLGIGYLSSYLKQHGIEVKIIDGLRDKLNDIRMLRAIMREKPDAVGITCLTAFYSEVVNLSKLIKNHNIPCIVGGIHPTFLPFSTLSDTQADFVVCGEGEIGLLKLIKNNFNNAGVKGVYSIKDIASDDAVYEKTEIIEHLDELAFPDWEQIDPRKYPFAPHGAFIKNFPIGVMITTRGCLYECTFCASPRFYNRKIRFRSAGNVIAEIKYLIEHFGVNEIHFEDDNLTSNRMHVEEISNLIITNKLPISWACPNGIRADKVDKELIRLMRRSGCYYFAYGVESAAGGILQNVKKHENIETIEKSIAIAEEEGISCQGFFIFGLPGETTETIEETIRFAKKSKLSRAQFLILDIIPGSELWYSLKGKFQPNWQKNSFKEPEWIPPGLTRRQLIKAQTRAFRVFYGRLPIFFKIMKLIRFRQLGYLFQRIREYRILGL